MSPFKFLKRGNDKVAETAQSQGDNELYSTSGEYGLKILAEPLAATIDIVFVHGLTGNRESRWTHKNKTFWPQDLLAKQLADARIIAFGYDADIVGAINTAGSNNLRRHGKSLSNDLATRRKISKTNQRPLIFLAHSLGGLVVEQALLVSRGSAELHVKDLLENTTGIVFMGTPHMGSNLADWGAALTRMSSLFRKTNKALVQVLQPGSEMLANVQQEFHTMLNDRPRNGGKTMDIFCFYEEIAMPTVGKIVPEHSAVLSAYLNQSIHGDHTSMTKFESDKDGGFIRVSERLYLWVEGAKEAQGQAEGGVQDGSEAQANAPRLLEYSGTVNSGGGPVFQGHQNAGRDMTYNFS